MNFQQWIAAVLAIAAQRGIVAQVEYPTPTWATFRWQCSNGTRFGTAGAGAEMIGLTTPEAFTWLWVCDVSPVLPEPQRPGAPPPPPPRSNNPQNDWIGARPRHVPRVPAMATAAALKELFKV